MVSVIIPVYNVSPYLNECLQSVVNQTYNDWECVLVDDGSTDGSGDICDSWVKRDERIKVIHQENGGVSKARNRGMEESKGDYVVFVDSDDWLDAHFLSHLMDCSADIVVMGYTIEAGKCSCEERRPDFTKVFALDGGSVDAFVSLNAMHLFYAPWAKLYKRTILQTIGCRFPENCSYGEDLQFNYQYLKGVETISQVAVANYHYRVSSEGSLSTKKRPNQFNQDYEQWKLLQAFYVNRGLWLEPSKELLYKRLWGIVYDGIFSTATSNKEILSIPEIRDLKNYQYVFHCSKWIKWCILHRIAFVFK